MCGEVLVPVLAEGAISLIEITSVMGTHREHERLGDTALMHESKIPQKEGVA